MNNYKIGLLGNFGRMHGLLSCEVCFFRVSVLRCAADSWSCAQALPLYKNTSVLVGAPPKVRKAITSC